MAEESKQTFTIRIPQQTAARIEEAARSNGVTATALIQSVISRKFRSPETTKRETEPAAETVLAAKLETLRKGLEALDRNEASRLGQLRFEIVKTRSALLHSLDQTLGAAAVDQIIEASETTAREYTAGVPSVQESKR
jgi:hypothetical protein